MALPAATPATNHASPTGIDPRLLAVASIGDLEELKKLLDRYMSRNSSMQQDADIERGTNNQEQRIPSLLMGVTGWGDTALHVVATNGDGQNFLDCASEIKVLLFSQNKNGDTPMHCAARAGHVNMVNRLINLAESEGTVKNLLRVENYSKETALHDAIRAANGIEIVEKLLMTDRELACFPTEGTSPMYLAVLLGKEETAQKLYAESKLLSYRGPNGQNALHAAVFRGRVLTDNLLKWNKDLAKETDKHGSTPLHLAVVLPLQWWVSAPNRWWFRRILVSPQVFAANKDALFQSDRDGLFPIHVAASVGALWTVAKFIRDCPGSVGLRDAKGRTFLHIAVEKRHAWVVRRACRGGMIDSIVNMQDNKGNTALHLAVQAGSVLMFSSLIARRNTNLDLTNAKEQTPLDIAVCNIPPGLFYTQNSKFWIRRALVFLGAKSGVSRKDYFTEKYEAIYGVKSDLDIKEREKLKDSTQILSVGSALIATATFGATFAIPGGYRQDDHINGGAPTLAGRFSFDAFMMANTMAFICSSIATAGFMYSGSPMVDLHKRKFHLSTSVYFMHTSITALAAAFALGVYLVLSPVARKTAIGICCMSPFVALWTSMDYFLTSAILLIPICVRKGPFLTVGRFAIQTVVLLFMQGWPLIFIFLWATYGRAQPISE